MRLYQYIFQFLCVILLCIVPYSLCTQCSELSASLFVCDFNCSCRYRVITEVNCTIGAKYNVSCEGDYNFTKEFNCLYCYQLPEDQYNCSANVTCSSTQHDYYVSSCLTSRDVICLGPRYFSKWRKCNFAASKYWKTTLFFSLFLGGLGADRFYLGYIGWGIFKLLSLGGVGIWTLVDAIMIMAGYLTPADGSLYRDL